MLSVLPQGKVAVYEIVSESNSSIVIFVLVCAAGGEFENLIGLLLSTRSDSLLGDVLVTSDF